MDHMTVWSSSIYRFKKGVCMKSVKLTATVVLLGCMAVSLLLFTPSSAQITKGKERPLLTKHLMSGLIKPHCNAIREALKAEVVALTRALDSEG